MAEQPPDRVVHGICPTAAGSVLEEVNPRDVGRLHRVVDVRSRTPVADGGLRHEGDEHPVLLGDLLQEHAQEHQPVGHLQDVGVAEVELELGVGPLGDDVLQPPAEFLEDVDESAEKPHGVDGILGIVAERLTSRTYPFARERIVVECLDRTAVPPAQGDELGLDPREPRISLRCGVTHDALERLAWTQVVRSVLPPEIRNHPRAGSVPGADDQGVEIGDRDLVGVSRRELGHERDRVHGELRPLAHAHVLEVAERHRLGLWDAEEVDPAREHVADPRLGKHRLRFADALDIGKRPGHGQ